MDPYRVGLQIERFSDVEERKRKEKDSGRRTTKEEKSQRRQNRRIYMTLKRSEYSVVEQLTKLAAKVSCYPSCYHRRPIKMLF